MKTYLWIGLAACVFASTFAVAQHSNERIVSLAEIVDAHQTPVRSWNFIPEMELNNCTLIVTVDVVNACQISNLGHTRITSTFDLRHVWQMSVSDNESRNIVSVTGSSPDNNTAFSKEFEKCDGTTSLVENGTGFGFPLNEIASRDFRSARIEFGGESCLGEGS